MGTICEILNKENHESIYWNWETFEICKNESSVGESGVGKFVGGWN